MVSRKQINKLRVNNTQLVTHFVPNFLSFHSRIKKKYGRINGILQVRVKLCSLWIIAIISSNHLSFFISISVALSVKNWIEFYKIDSKIRSLTFSNIFYRSITTRIINDIWLEYLVCFLVKKLFFKCADWDYIYLSLKIIK